jgi:formate hydrogenlyase subunit 4
MLIAILNLLLLVALAPLVSGLISRIKNNLRMRRGQSVFQPYYNLAKLCAKEEVISETASWIFKAAPIVVIASMLAAAALMPWCIVAGPLGRAGDLLALIFIFSLGRFFLALAALDTGSSFGGMGSSREMFISSLTEPVFCLVVFTLSLQFGSTDIAAVSGMHAVSVASIIAATALFLVTLAETARVPVDNQETHLELTMVHEAMVLEYSGRRLAFIEMASYIKQMILFFLIAQIVFPIALPVFGGVSEIILWLLWYAARLVIVAIAVALVEVAVAKMRLFRVADFLGYAFVLSIVAVLCALLGV